VAVKVERAVPTGTEVFPDVLLIPMRFRKEKVFEVGTDHGERTFEVSPVLIPDSFRPFFDAIMEGVKKEYAERLKDQIAAKKHQFGFASIREQRP
jgi:hypothetical protein